MMATGSSSMTLFTEESMKKNRTNKKHRMDCKISGDMIEYDDGGKGWKHTIRLNELDEVEMNEKVTINKHKYENIICLKRGNEIKFLKANTRSQMQDWYSELMSALSRFGWVDPEPESTVEGEKRRATNPEGMKRPRAKTPLSAYGGLEGNFQRDPRKPIEESPESSTESDESSNDSPTGKHTPIYEDQIIAAPKNRHPNMTAADEQEHTYVNTLDIQKRKPPVPVRKESIGASTTGPKVPVESDESQYMPLLPRTEITHSTSDDYRATKDNGFKTDLENILSSAQCPPSMTRKPGATMNDCSATASNQPVKSKSLATVPSLTKPERQEKSEGIATITRKTKSFRLPPSQPLTLQRKSSVQLPVMLPKPVTLPKPKKNPDKTMTPRPQLPKRNGQTLKSATENFRKCQEEDSIPVNLNKEIVSNGKRLCLVNVKGLGHIWIDHWNPEGTPLEEIIHPGDQILSINGIGLEKSEVTFAYDMMANVQDEQIRLTVRRAPYANVLLLQRTPECQDLGIEIDGNVIKKVHPDGLFRQASRGKATGVLSPNLVEWAITEINMQPVNFNHTTEQIQYLLDEANPHVALVIQPADLIQAMKVALTHCPMCGGVAHSHD